MNIQRTCFNIFLIILLASLASCGGDSAIKPEKKLPEANQKKPDEEAKLPSTQPKDTTAKETTGKGGYYLDDGPGENAPADIDSIPDASLKTEELSLRANKPYIALEQQYTPMTAYMPYKKQGTASWYGKRYHGKKTSTGEVYDMYGMTAAHTILPIPSYAKVTNVANGRSVIVRINDRGPFKNGRLVDLSYAAAYKLRIVDQGSAQVEVEAIDTSFEALEKKALPTKADAINQEFEPVTPKTSAVQTSKNKQYAAASVNGVLPFFVQVGAFKNEANSLLLLKKMESYQHAENVQVVKVYNKGIYRVKVGPYTTRIEADTAASQIRKQFSTPAIVQN